MRAVAQLHTLEMRPQRSGTRSQRARAAQRHALATRGALGGPLTAWRGVEPDWFLRPAAAPLLSSQSSARTCPRAAAQWSAEWPMPPPRSSRNDGSCRSAAAIAARSPPLAASSHARTSYSSSSSSPPS
eukprot:5678989-Prymnesium_polylepis.1